MSPLGRLRHGKKRREMERESAIDALARRHFIETMAMLEARGIAPSALHPCVLFPPRSELGKMLLFGRRVT
jgi:hypothetical protein